MSKAARITRIDNSLWTEEELVRRLPEVDYIYDPQVRKSTVNTFLSGCPDYFWELPTSSSGKYHSPDERGKHGNWIHTKRVFAEYCNLSESYLEAGIISEHERECGKSAALLHDMMKYGWPSENNEHTVSNHDLIASDVASNLVGCPEEIASLIETHMGSWGDGPEPRNEREWLFHLADKSAAGIDEDNRAIYHPAEELLDEWPELRTIEVGEDEEI